MTNDKFYAISKIFDKSFVCIAFSKIDLWIEDVSISQRNADDKYFQKR